MQKCIPPFMTKRHNSSEFNVSINQCSINFSLTEAFSIDNNQEVSETSPNCWDSGHWMMKLQLRARVVYTEQLPSYGYNREAKFIMDSISKKTDKRRHP